MKKKGLFSVVEMSLALLLFFGVYFLFVHTSSDNPLTHQDLTLASYLSYFQNDSNLRTQLFLENLTNTTFVNANWTSFENNLSQRYLHYGIILSNSSNSKTILSCNSTYTNEQSSLFFYQENLTSANLRILIVEVCK